MGKETWGSLSDKEKAYFGGSKTTFQAARNAAKAGGGDISRAKSIRDFVPKSSPAPSPSPPAQQEAKSRATTYHAPANIQNYDLTAAGAGATKGTNRISGKDINNMRDAGYATADIIKFAEGAIAGGSKYGQNTLNKLSKLRSAMEANDKLDTSPAPTPTPTPTPPVTPVEPPKEDEGSGFTPGQKFDIVQGVLDTGNNTQAAGATGYGTNISRINTQVAVDTGDIDVRDSTVQGDLVSGNKTVDQSMTAVSGAFLDDYMDKVAPSIDDGESVDLDIPAQTPTSSGTNISTENTQASVDSGDISAVNSYIGGDMVSGNKLVDQSMTITSHGGGGKGPGFNNMQLSQLYGGLNNLALAKENEGGSTGSRFAGSVLAEVDQVMKPQVNVNNYYDAVQKSLANDQAMATNFSSLLYGDMFNQAFKGLDWKVPNPTKKPEIDYTKSDEILSKIS